LEEVISTLTGGEKKTSMPATQCAEAVQHQDPLDLHDQVTKLTHVQSRLCNTMEGLVADMASLRQGVTTRQQHTWSKSHAGGKEEAPQQIGTATALAELGSKLKGELRAHADRLQDEVEKALRRSAPEKHAVCCCCQCHRSPNDPCKQRCGAACKNSTRDGRQMEQAAAQQEWQGDTAKEFVQRAELLGRLEAVRKECLEASQQQQQNANSDGNGNRAAIVKDVLADALFMERVVPRAVFETQIGQLSAKIDALSNGQARSTQMAPDQEQIKVLRMHTKELQTELQQLRGELQHLGVRHLDFEQDVQDKVDAAIATEVQAAIDGLTIELLPRQEFDRLRQVVEAVITEVRDHLHRNENPQESPEDGTCKTQAFPDLLADSVSKAFPSATQAGVDELQKFRANAEAQMAHLQADLRALQQEVVKISSKQSELIHQQHTCEESLRQVGADVQRVQDVGAEHAETLQRTLAASLGSMQSSISTAFDCFVPRLELLEQLQDLKNALLSGDFWSHMGGVQSLLKTAVVTPEELTALEARLRLAWLQAQRHAAASADGPIASADQVPLKEWHRQLLDLQEELRILSQESQEFPRALEALEKRLERRFHAAAAARISGEGGAAARDRARAGSQRQRS